MENQYNFTKFTWIFVDGNLVSNLNNMHYEEFLKKAYTPHHELNESDYKYADLGLVKKVNTFTVTD